MVPKSSIIFIQALVFGFICGLIILLLIFQDYTCPHTVAYVVSILIVVLFLWVVGSWYLINKRLFDPYILFILAAFLFNGGQAIIEILDVTPKEFFEIYFRTSARTVSQALMLVTLGLTAFHLGGLLGTVKRKNVKKCQNEYTDHTKYQAMRFVGWILLLIALIPTIQGLQSTFNIVMAVGYRGIFQIEVNRGLAASPRVLSFFLIPGVMFLLAGSNRRFFPIIVSTIVLVIFAVIQFFLGSRRLAIMPLIAYAWLWHKTIHRLPKIPVIIGGSLILFVVFPLITAYRLIPGEARLNNPNLILDIFLSIENPIVAIISEMAITLFTVAWTLDLVPSIRPFDYGTSYLYSILAVVPNLFWEVHPTSARIIADWLSLTVTPAKAAVGGGWGYSFIAEAYLNFGWIGAPVILIIIGWIFSRFVLWGEDSQDIAKIATVATFLSFFILFVRGESANMIRYFLWYSILPYFLVIIVNRYFVIKSSHRTVCCHG